MLGVDIVKIERIERALKNDHFKRRVFFESEIEYAEKKHNSVQTFAGIYAVKEAVIKAVGRKIKNLCLDKIEVLHNEHNAPYCKILEGLEISISHEREYAIAVASIKSNPLDTLALSSLNFEDIPILKKEDIVFADRENKSHKYNYSVVSVIGGSAEMIGAPLLAYESARTALEFGAGLARLCVPYSLKGAYQKRVKEETLLFLSDKNGKIKFNKRDLDRVKDRADCIVIGMGMAQNKNIKKIIAYLCQSFCNTLVIDADGLNSISNDLNVLNEHKCKLILTPHIGEFNRLDKNNGDLSDRAIDFALKHNCVLLVKSEKTLITDGVKAFINAKGSPCMAKAGTGDVLAGAISAFSCFMSPIEACKTACFLLGERGEQKAKQLGENSVLASDLYLS